MPRVSGLQEEPASQGLWLLNPENDAVGEQGTRVEFREVGRRKHCWGPPPGGLV